MHVSTAVVVVAPVAHVVGVCVCADVYVLICTVGLCLLMYVGVVGVYVLMHMSFVCFVTLLFRVFVLLLVCVVGCGIS